MGKLLYSATMSLDGFIAGPGGDMSCFTEYLGPNWPRTSGSALCDEVVVLTRSTCSSNPRRALAGPPLWVELVRLGEPLRRHRLTREVRGLR
jgi:hypothetical protein